MSVIDRRAASSKVLAGPTDLVGEEIVPIELIEVDGVTVGVPRLMSGAAEWATVSAAEATAEATAEAYRDAALGQLDHRGKVPCLDISAAVNFRLNAGTAVASAGVGLEAYASFHLDRLAGETAAAAAERPLNERYADDLPTIFGVEPPTQESWWLAFRRVQSLAALQRHAIERPVRKRGLVGEKSLNQRFYDREYAGAADTMLAAFEYFTPGWISDDRQAALRALTDLPA
jgi:hypothetical protein